jgi:alkylhydroperoxidase/carboxymuconolactone decarboxylase family protein YurZ
MWDNVKQVMAPGALDPVTKELVYIAVSITNNCPYCIARRIESRVATIDHAARMGSSKNAEVTSRHVQDKQGSHGRITRTHPREDR